VGAFLAQAERLLPDWSRTELRHTVIAVGGGALPLGGRTSAAAGGG
jgi:hypothetical protein